MLDRSTSRIGEFTAHPASEQGVETVGQRLRISAKLFGFLVQLRTRYDLDLHAFQIISAFNLAGLAEQQREHGAAAPFSAETFSAALTATALSEMTGIPRQTIRRRLQALHSQGYLSPAEDGSYKMTGHWRDLDIVDEVGGLIAGPWFDPGRVLQTAS